MNLSYCKTLQRAWDRYTLDDDDKGAAPRTPRVRSPWATEEQKLAHLNAFMAANKAHGTVYKDYENSVGLKNGNLVTYTKWLMAGRLPSASADLLEFFTARWAANKVVKRETAHAE